MMKEKKNMSREEPNRFRLPSDVLPTSYKLTLWPNLKPSEDPPKFQGKVFIDVDIVEPTNEIVLNTADLVIEDVVFIRDDKGVKHQRFVPQDIVFDVELERVRFVFSEKLEVGHGTLMVVFSGTHNDNLKGFYRSQHELDGEKRWMVATQFEATDARRAFPCWDEPAIKAIFQVTLVIPRDLVAISNTPVLDETVYDERGVKFVSFAETPKMSTYLLAFIVGEFERIGAKTKDGVDVGVYTLPGKTEQGKFALDVAAQTLEYFTDYFGIPYPLPKLDNVAIPDFAAGAMENWGVVTYRETALLVDPVQSAATARQRVAEVVCHELAHQWFGNLVTMKWWTDLWLNEGFASWIGNKAVDVLFPDWDMWTMFVAYETNSGLALDGLKNTHPIEVVVNDPKEIDEIFDAISYSKGASVIRMLEDFLGEDVFRDGLRFYLDRYRYSNAETADLWQALEENSKKPVRELMTAWTKQAGYPVVDVVISGADNQVELRQSRFLYDRDALDAGDSALIWPIPIRIATKLRHEEKVFMKEKNGTFAIGAGDSAENSWLEANADRVGFYRVNYGEEGWRRLMPAIRSLSLSPRDRLGIQSDLYALQKAGYIPAAQFLEAVAAYENETELAVWEALALHMAGIDSLLAREPYYEKFRVFARRVFDNVVLRVGWDERDGERHVEVILRSVVLGAAGSYGHLRVIEESKSRFAKLLETAELNPNLRKVVYGVVAQEGSKEEHEALIGLYRQAAFQEEKLRILLSLGRFRGQEFIRNVLEFSLSTEVRLQDLAFGIAGTASNHHARDHAWEFTKEKWIVLTDRLGESKSLLGYIIETTTSMFTEREKEAEVREFFDRNPVPQAKRTIEQSLERIRLNAKWLERNRTSLENWFARR